MESDWFGDFFFEKKQPTVYETRKEIEEKGIEATKQNTQKELVLVITAKIRKCNAKCKKENVKCKRNKKGERTKITWKKVCRVSAGQMSFPWCDKIFGSRKLNAHA